MATESTNVLLLAASNPEAVLKILRSDSSQVTVQDNHGYSLLHAAASWNQADLLRSLADEFNITPNLLDEDGETALFVAETLDIASILLDIVKVDPTIRNEEGQTAEEKIKEEGDWPELAAYLEQRRTTLNNGSGSSSTGSSAHLPPLPKGVTLDMQTVPESVADVPGTPDAEFRKRIEDLAARSDFQDESGQADLRSLVQDVIKGIGHDDKNSKLREG